ncbi:MAG: FAD-binding protein [Anaerolineae bacterium]|nr:FAD-binding protein [Anaerolineae bacterium]
MTISPFTYSPTDVVTPNTTEAAAALFTENADRPLLFRGGGTKWDAGHRAAAESSNPLIISTANLTGILEYDPGELTVTVRAGTPLATVIDELAKNGQYLPFDPILADAGATVGGTVAAGLGGPRRLRYGGLRDFVIGMSYLNADGERIRSGGKVVKNAAGYDFTKLFCGSMGSLGMITEVSFKVFPKPQGSRTLLALLPDIASLQAAFKKLQASPTEISAADAWLAGTLAAPELGSGYLLAVLIEGAMASLEARCNTVRGLINATASQEIENHDEQLQLWESLRDLAWIGDQRTVLKCYLASSRTPDLDALLAKVNARRVFSAAGNVAWAAFDGDPQELSAALAASEITAAVWRSAVPAPDVIPPQSSALMIKRVKQAFDPRGRFYAPRSFEIVR